MKLEDICVSLGFAKQLKEAGYTQEDSLFYWLYSYSYENHTILERTATNKLHDEDFSAPTITEIGERLPWCIHRKSEMPYYLTIRKRIQDVDHDEWVITYEREYDKNLVSFTSFDPPIADIYAKMWLYLKKECFI